VCLVSVRGHLLCVCACARVVRACARMCMCVCVSACVRWIACVGGCMCGGAWMCACVCQCVWLRACVRVPVCCACVNVYSGVYACGCGQWARVCMRVYVTCAEAHSKRNTMIAMQVQTFSYLTLTLLDLRSIANSGPTVQSQPIVPHPRGH
jgi:hypothetical protein